MSDAIRSRLVADLVPVKRVASPGRQLAIWFAFTAAVAICLAAFADLPFVVHSLMIVPDMWIAELGAWLTAASAAFAAILLNRPDRSPRWALLPVPALVLWISASCVGTARMALLSPGPFSAMEAMLYSGWVCGCSVPLAALTFWLLRRGYALYPRLAGTVAGLAVASTAAALMVLFHPGEAPLANLLVHGAAVVVVTLVGNWLGRRLFSGRFEPAKPVRPEPSPRDR